jgi:hypothetical protein
MQILQQGGIRFMHKRAIVSLLFVFTMFAAAATVSAQWRKIGSKEVDYRVDHDTINVPVYKGDFRRIQLRVKRAPVRFQRVVVHFRNGGDQELEFRDLIRAGGQTRSIDLTGRERQISTVDLWYETASMNRRKAEVSVWGRD